MLSDHGSSGSRSTTGSRFAQRVQAISEIATQWSNYGLQTVICQMDADWPEGNLLVGLIDIYVDTPYLPVWLHLARIRHLRMDNAVDTGLDFVDEVRIELLPAERSAWPLKARVLALRSWDGEHGRADLGIEMAWVEIRGPWSMEAIAQIIDVSVVPPQLEPFCNEGH